MKKEVTVHKGNEGEDSSIRENDIKGLINEHPGCNILFDSNEPINR